MLKWMPIACIDQVLWSMMQITVPHCLGMTKCICIEKVHAVLTSSFAEIISVQSQGLVAFCIAAKSHVVLSDA